MSFSGSVDYPHVYGNLESRRLRLIINFEPRDHQSSASKRDAQDTSGWNFVPQPDLTRYYKGSRKAQLLVQRDNSSPEAVPADFPPLGGVVLLWAQIAAQGRVGP
jgi:hypothetical protein